jgi:DNA-3-methyladenine glycosylase
VKLMRKRRGARPRDIDLTNGPGKLCAALGIDGAMNGLSLQRGEIVIREGAAVAESEIVVTSRIGITKCADWPLRYLVGGNRFVSR